VRDFWPPVHADVAAAFAVVIDESAVKRTMSKVLAILGASLAVSRGKTMSSAC